MSGAPLYPGADRTSQWRGSGGTTMKTVDKLLLHTTESRGWPAYPSFQPTLTFNPWMGRGFRWRQHLPINGSASTLANDGSFRTNRASVCQVEIVGYCDPKQAGSGFHVSKISADALAELGDFLAWLHEQWSVPLRIIKGWPAYPKSYGRSNGVRLSAAAFSSFAGVLGHCHAPGNDHGDPGDLDVAAILASAVGAPPVVKPTPPVVVTPPVSTPAPAPHVTSAPRSLININCQWPGFSSTKKSARPWSARRPQLASAIEKSAATLVIAQELGHLEAADLFSDLGARWHYQRNGLNVVGWHDGAWSKVGETREWSLSSFGQLARTCLAVKLAHADGQYVWLAGSHLAAAASDLTPAAAVRARAAQARELATIFADYRQIVFGADLNDRGEKGGPRAVLAAGGWSADVSQVRVAGLSGDAKHGIDAVLTKKRAHVTFARIVPLGDASDHDARQVTFTTTS